jgi:hypothetical protein
MDNYDNDDGDDRDFDDDYDNDDDDDDDFELKPLVKRVMSESLPSETPPAKKRKLYEWETLQKRVSEVVKDQFRKPFTFFATIKKIKSGPYIGGKMYR